MYARPRLDDGNPTTLGVSGKLWREALIMYDRGTRSLWSQIDGQAKAGPMVGQSLEKIPSQVTTWAAWKRRHPETLVLVKPKLEGSPYASYHDSASWVGLPWTRGPRDDRLPPKTLVLGIDLGDGRRVAIGPESLGSGGIVSGDLGGRALLVVGPSGPREALVYSPMLEGERLDFKLEPKKTSGSTEAPPKLIDGSTGSTWDWLTGTAESGPLAGSRLEPIAATPIYWSTWLAFHPESELW